MAFYSRIWAKLEKGHLDLLRSLRDCGSDGARLDEGQQKFTKLRGQPYIEWLDVPVALGVIERVPKDASVRATWLRITAEGEGVIAFDDRHRK